MPRTLDSEDFDIHKFEHPEPEVYPVTDKEKIDPRVLKGVDESKEPKATKKTLLIATAANLLIPGLGNMILKKGTVGSLLLAVNILLSILSIAPFSIVGFLGNLYAPKLPTLVSASFITSAAGEASLAGDPALSPLINLAMAIAAITWLHFIYLVLKRK